MDEIAITIISVEEILRGALDEIRQAQSRRRGVVEAYVFFQRLQHDLQRFAILAYSADADRIHQTMTAPTKRLGGQDCRIAAIAMANACTIVTANTQHFSRIPGVIFEDWTHE
jgi:predicted nucleic acid-binding protein